MTTAKLTSSTALDPGTVGEVLTVIAAAAESDGSPPLSEQSLLGLRADGGAGALHLVAEVDAGGAAPLVAGYARAEIGQGLAEPVAELVVHPRSRRHGVGSALLRAVEEAALADPAAVALRLWAHGDHPGARHLARTHGYLDERRLWQMRRSLAPPSHWPPSHSPLPDGVRIRPFRPGADDAAWLALNARAFADHPEQGRWRHDDLLARQRQPWFDPEGFLLAVDATDEQLVGFHWTKVHPHPASDPVGEVYVLGVDPRARGRGLGPALTVAGLEHLRRRGLRQVLLYVDEENAAAVATYRKLGFTRWSVDVQYRKVIDRTVV